MTTLPLTTLTTLNRQQLGEVFKDPRTLLAFERIQRQVAEIIPETFTAFQNLDFVVTQADGTVPNAHVITEGANINVAVAAGHVTLSATPSGASGQIQYNNAGAFGAFTMSGDATLNAFTGVLTLATVNANVGTFGDGLHVGQFTVNGKGLITGASSIPIPVFTSVAAGFAPASGGGTANFLRADGTWAVPPGTTSGGTLINVRYLTSGSGTYTPTAGTNSVIVQLVGGGAGGGGVAASAAGQATLAPGGQAGGFLQVRLTSGFSGVSYAIGAAGTGGAAGNNAGSDGGDTTFGTFTAKGGKAQGPGTGPFNFPWSRAWGTFANVTSGGDIAISGGVGFPALALSHFNVTSSPGGASQFSPGSPAFNAGVPVTPAAPYGYGGGGGGAASEGGGGSAAGGPGSGGGAFIYEYS